MSTSNLPVLLVTSRGARTDDAVSSPAKYCSMGLPFTVMAPEPSRRKTLATDVLRLPVATERFLTTD